MARTERIPQGGALTVFRPELAAQGFYRDPAATGKYYAGAAYQTAQNIASNMGQKRAQAMQSALFPRSALLGGALLAAPSLMGAAEAASEGRTLEAGVTAAGGIGSAAIASQLLKGPLPAKVAGVALGLGGGLLSGGLGQMAERTKAAATGQEIAGEPGSSSAARGRRKKEAETDLAIYNQAMQAEFQNFQQLNDYMRDAYIQDEQRLTPIINQRKNAELARNQALMNTMTGNYARLGMLATAGKLATGAQAERGATMRTALQSNPYSGAIMQAPSISF
jgi:hypothetical protein